LFTLILYEQFSGMFTEILLYFSTCMMPQGIPVETSGKE